MNAPHLIIEARAGTGKTTTLVESLKILKGIDSKIDPSEQQKAIWDAVSLSPRDATCSFVAFNKSIALELQSRVPKGCEASTMHSLGFKAISKAYGRLEVNRYTVQDNLAHLMDLDADGFREFRRKHPVMVRAIQDMVRMVKLNLSETDPITLEEIAHRYDIDLVDEGKNYRKDVLEIVPKMIELCGDPKGQIDFDDMVWLPVKNRLPVQKFDVLMVDERQDLGRCQQALAFMAGRRLIFCGDSRQSIYGFAGADTDSMKRLEEKLAETPEGVKKLPLTVTRRCGRAIVREANRIVPDLQAHESCPDGKVFESEMRYKTVGGVEVEIPYHRTYAAIVTDGDMVLCRTNAPLVRECLWFTSNGRKASIQGRNIGEGLVSLVEKMKAETMHELGASLDRWLSEESVKEWSRKNPDESKITQMRDKVECIRAIMEGCGSVAKLVGKIAALFTDDEKSKGIRLSSIHKAKGLEADRVFILPTPYEMKISQPWQAVQEENLQYVAITRAKAELCYVN